MKKNFMTRVLAVALSAAMALSMATATNLTVAEAASKPAMKTSSFKVRIGNKAKNYYASAATQKAYKIVKAKAGNTDKATAKVVKSGKAVAITAGSKTGKTTIKLTFKNKKTAAKTTIKFAGKVLAAKETVAKIESIKQVTTTQIEVALTATVAEVKAEDFTILRDSDNTVIPVKAVALKDKTVTVDTYTKMADGGSYTVTYVPVKSDAKFTATAGVVAAVDITPTTVTKGKETTLYYLTFDENGIQLDKQKINAKVDSKIDITSVNKVGAGYISGNKIYLNNVGDTMEVTVKYHSYKYENGVEVGAVSKTVAITAVENAATLDKVKYTITSSIAPYNYVNWTKYTPVTTIAMGDKNKALQIRIADSNGEDITATCGYKFESANGAVVLCSGEVKTAQTITAVGEGSTYILVKDKSGSTVTTLPVTVTPKRILGKVVLSKGTATIATGQATDNSIACDTISVLTYDQYGDPFTASVDIALKSAPSTIAEASYATVKTGMISSAAVPNTNVTAVTVGKANNSSYTDGSYTYLATVTDKYGNKQEASFGVNVVSVKDGDVSYGMILVKNKDDNGLATKTQAAIEAPIDTTITAATTGQDVRVGMEIVSRKNGVIDRVGSQVSEVTVCAITVKKNGAVIAATGADLTKPVTCAGISNNANFGAGKLDILANTGGPVQGTQFVLDICVADFGTSTFDKYLGAGIYTVEATIQQAGTSAPLQTVLSNTFEVKDSQGEATVVVTNTSLTSKTLSAALTKLDNATFFYDGDALTTDGKTLGHGCTLTWTASNDDYAVVSGKSCTLKKIKAKIKALGTNYFFNTEIPVYKMFTSTSDAGSWS